MHPYSKDRLSCRFLVLWNIVESCQEAENKTKTCERIIRFERFSEKFVRCWQWYEYYHRVNAYVINYYGFFFSNIQNIEGVWEIRRDSFKGLQQHQKYSNVSSTCWTWWQTKIQNFPLSSRCLCCCKRYQRRRWWHSHKLLGLIMNQQHHNITWEL